MLRCRFSGKRQWMHFFSLSGSMRFWRPLQTAMRGNCISSGFCMISGGTILRWDRSFRRHILCCIVWLHASRGIYESSCCQCTLSDDLRVGGQADSDPDRGLCSCVQLDIFSWNGSWFHQVNLQNTLTCEGEVTAAVTDLRSLGLCRFYVWEILHSTIRKMNKHVQKIQKELDEAKEKLEKQHNKKVEKKTLVHVGFCSNHTALWFIFCNSDLWDCLFFTVTFVRAYIASFVCAVQTVSIWNVNIGCCSNNVSVGPKPTHFLIQQLVRINQTDDWKFGFWLVTMSCHSIELVPETTYAVEEGLLHLF